MPYLIVSGYKVFSTSRFGEKGIHGHCLHWAVKVNSLVVFSAIKSIDNHLKKKRLVALWSNLITPRRIPPPDLIIRRCIFI